MFVNFNGESLPDEEKGLTLQRFTEVTPSAKEPENVFGLKCR